MGTQRPPSPGTEGGMWFVYPEISGTSAEIPEKKTERFLVEALTSLSHGNRRAGSKTRDRSRRSLQRPASPNSGSHGFVC